MSAAPTTTCNCGHALRIHSVLEDPEHQECRACRCDAFTAAADDLNAMEATEAARAAGEHRERTYTALRRAVANWHLQEARRLIGELIDG